MKQRKAIRKLEARQKAYPAKASPNGDWSSEGGTRHAYHMPGSLKK